MCFVHSVKCMLLFNSLSRHSYYLYSVNEETNASRHLLKVTVLVGGKRMLQVCLIPEPVFSAVLLDCLPLGWLGKRVGREDMAEGTGRAEE